MKLFIVFGVCATLSTPVLAQDVQPGPESGTAVEGGTPPAETTAPATNQPMSNPSSYSDTAPAAPSSPPPHQNAASNIDWGRGVTIVDGAAVYEAPNFDSPVLEYIGEGKQIVISRKPVRGIGGLGLFYKLKANGGKIYYITDTDIKVDRNYRPDKDRDQSPKVQRATREEPPKRRNKPRRRTQVDPETGEEITPYFTRYMGGAIGLVNFSERFSGRTLSDDILMYGFRMTGPGTIIDGPPIDFNFLFSLKAPGYYSSTLRGSASGFMVFGDIMPMFPVFDRGNLYGYVGMGLMYTYTSFKVKIKKSLFDSQEIRLGADFGAGVGMRIKQRYMARADVKYYWERSRYLGYFLTAQMEY